MTIPILIDGREQGALETRREGAYTLFEARCAYLPGVRRLWVFGEEGERACLGVMQPERGELRLRRRLSRAALRGFPGKIAYAGFAERGKAAPPRPARGASARDRRSQLSFISLLRKPGRCGIMSMGQRKQSNPRSLSLPNVHYNGFIQQRNGAISCA